LKAVCSLEYGTLPPSPPLFVAVFVAKADPPRIKSSEVVGRMTSEDGV